MTSPDKGRPEWIEQLADAIVERLARLACDKAVSAAELRGRDVGPCAAASAPAAISGHMHLRDDSVA